VAHGQNKRAPLTCSSDNCQGVGCIQNVFINEPVDAIVSYTVKALENTKVGGDASMVRTGLDTSHLGKLDKLETFQDQAEGCAFCQER